MASAEGVASSADSVERGMKVVEELQATAVGARWSFVENLAYEVNVLSDGRTASTRLPPGLVTRKCQRASCEEKERAGEKGPGAEGGSAFSTCAKCGAPYCSRACQVKDWKRGGHKMMCSQLKLLREGHKVDKQEALLGGLQKIRLYMCPFAVCKAKTQGPGFVFVQSSCLATDFHFKLPVNACGEALSRSLLLAYMTMDEFADLVKDDFEMGVVRQPLIEALAACDPLKRLVVLVRTRCGFVGVLDFPLVPDHGICAKLGEDYVEHSTLQLNLDDT